MSWFTLYICAVTIDWIYKQTNTAAGHPSYHAVLEWNNVLRPHSSA